VACYADIGSPDRILVELNGDVERDRTFDDPVVPSTLESDWS
jgi:hypothetical protein